MTDKEKFRKEVEKLKSNLIHGACASQIAMETRCKKEAYDEVISLLDSLQEEPKKCMYTKDHYTDEDRKVLCDGFEEECEFNKKEPVSEDLEEASRNYTDNEEYGDDVYFAIKAAFKAGAKWQEEKDNEEKVLTYKHSFKDCKEHIMKNIWKSADGDDLPEIDREVIALLDNGKVVYTHRPPEYWDGKDIVTGKVTRHYPKTYDKGGWNIPNIKYWLDCLLPNMEED